jgi:hypothetical protein
MRFLVRPRGCFGSIRAGIPVDDELTTRPVEGMDVRITIALLCREHQKNAALPMLAENLRMNFLRIARDDRARVGLRCTLR